MFTATDLKQYSYCPRVLYYHHCLPDIRPTTDKMEIGKAAHDAESAREARRSLAPYGLTTAERHFDVGLESEALGIRGRVDMVLATPNGVEGIAHPVEFKNAHQAHDNWQLQVTVYALLLESAWGVRVTEGCLYLIPARRAERLSITPRLRQRAHSALAQMRQIAEREWMPDPPKARGKCLDCEFRRFCNDV